MVMVMSLRLKFLYMLSDKNYVVPKQKVKDYINKVLAIPYYEFIEYIKENKGVIEDDQLTQSSNFAACSSEMCHVIESQGNLGMRFVDIGQQFPQYIKQKNETAYRKYGENQVKTAAQLGLAFEYYDYWYLTCVGYVYNELDLQQQEALLARTVLRIPLYQDLLLRLFKGDVFLTSLHGFQLAIFSLCLHVVFPLCVCILIFFLEIRTLLL